MAITMRYGFEIRDIAGTDDIVVRGGAKAVTVGGVTIPAMTMPGGGTPKFDLDGIYTTQDAASAAAKSWNRQMQGSGYDARTEVYGQPVGTEVANSVYTLTAEEKACQLYEKVDTIGKGLRQRINDANRSKGVGGSGYSPDVK